MIECQDVKKTSFPPNAINLNKLFKVYNSNFRVSIHTRKKDIF